MGAVRVEEKKSVFVCDIEGRVRPAIGLVQLQCLGAESCQNWSPLSLPPPAPDDKRRVVEDG